MLDDRLAQQGVQERGRARPEAVGPEQLAVDEPLQLALLGRREFVYVLQPAVLRSRGRTAATEQGETSDRPGRMPGPTPDRRQISRMEPAQPLAPDAVGGDGGIRRLEEDAVAALPREQPVRPQGGEAGGGVAVIGGVHPLERRPQRRRQTLEIRYGHRLDRLAHRLQLEPVKPGRGGRVPALVALGVVAIVVDEGGAVGLACGADRGRHDGRVQAAGEFGQHAPPGPHHPRHRPVDHVDQGGGIVVGAPPHEGRRPPQRHVGDAASRSRPASGADSRQPLERKTVAEERRRAQQEAEGLPVHRQPGGEDRIQRLRRPVRRQCDRAPAPPDQVEGPGWIPEEVQASGAVPPDQQIGPPAILDQAAGQRRPLREAAGDRRGMSALPAPFADEDMVAMDLRHRPGEARTGEDPQPLKVEAHGPALPAQRLKTRLHLRIGGRRPRHHEVSPRVQVGGAHRTMIGV